MTPTPDDRDFEDALWVDEEEDFDPDVDNTLEEEEEDSDYWDEEDDIREIQREYRR